MHLEKRFLSFSNQLKLVLYNQLNEVVAEMDGIYMSLEYYKPENNYRIHCIDQDPSPMMVIYTSKNPDEAALSFGFSPVTLKS